MRLEEQPWGGTERGQAVVEVDDAEPDLSTGAEEVPSLLPTRSLLLPQAGEPHAPLQEQLGEEPAEAGEHADLARDRAAEGCRSWAPTDEEGDYCHGAPEMAEAPEPEAVVPASADPHDSEDGDAEAGAVQAEVEEAGAAEVGAQGADAEELTPQSFQLLQKERVAMLYELCNLKAKFELTFETLRSILRLDAAANWPDIIERCEALALLGAGTPGGGDATSGGVLQQVPAAETDPEREQLEENLEAQTAYNARLRELLQKQQQLLDMTAQLDWKKASERTDALLVECDELREQLRQQQEARRRQEAVIRGQAQRIAGLEAQLEHGRQQMAADHKRQQAEDERQKEEGKRLRADSERKRTEVRELVTALSRQEDLVERLRSQLEVHEAAERRRHSYHPATRPYTAEDCGSEHGSSAQPKQQTRPVGEMDKEEREAFLSHFPMASRTERHLRNRLDDRKRQPRPGASPVA